MVILLVKILEFSGITWMSDLFLFERVDLQPQDQTSNQVKNLRKILKSERRYDKLLVTYLMLVFKTILYSIIYADIKN